MLQPPPRVDLSNDPPSWSPRFSPATTFGAPLRQLARDVDGDAPGYPEASRAERPAGVKQVRETCAGELRGWRAKDATLAVSAVEGVRTELLRLAAQVYRTDDTYVGNQEVNRRLADMVPLRPSPRERTREGGAPVEEP